MKYIFLTIICSLALFQAQAQDDDIRIPDYDTKITVGTALSSTFGSGLSYGITKDKHGFTLSLLPYFQDNISNTNFGINYFNFGLAYNYYIRKGDYIDFSLKTGVQRVAGSLFDDSDQFFETARISAGIGPEITFHLLPEIDITMNLGYGLYNLTDGLNSNVSGGIGFYYNHYNR